MHIIFDIFLVVHRIEKIEKIPENLSKFAKIPYINIKFVIFLYFDVGLKCDFSKVPLYKLFFQKNEFVFFAP